MRFCVFPQLPPTAESDLPRDVIATPSSTSQPVLSMRSRRIENEWVELTSRQEAHSDLELRAREDDRFRLVVRHMPALLKAPVLDGRFQFDQESHQLTMVFPRFYPAMPVEFYLDAPVFHPNVHPINGFVCLWNRHRIQTTCLQTLAQLQRVLAWQLVNADPEHLMQREALLWYQAGGDALLPLPCTPWLLPGSLPPLFSPVHGSMRSRLSPLSTEKGTQRDH